MAAESERTAELGVELIGGLWAGDPSYAHDKFLVRGSPCKYMLEFTLFSVGGWRYHLVNVVLDGISGGFGTVGHADLG